MRLAPALGTCWLATVTLLTGCGIWDAPKAAQVPPPKSPSAVHSAGRAVSASHRSHDCPVSVPHLKDSDIHRSREIGDGQSTIPGVSADIEREMADARAEWEARGREMRSDLAVLPASSELGARADSKASDLLVTDRMLAIERKYAPRYLNCRIRIRLLESRLADASGAPKDVLLRKLELAKTELAAVDKAYAAEIEIARLKTVPMIGKDAQ